MTQILKRTVVPIVDKFYVYALFKPNDFNPFYVGKGKGTRINNHFKPSALSVNTRKTGVIKKYGDSIRREILCYFTKEQDAYEFEEYMIALYGLQSEGGCLTNYAKTRFEYSDEFNKVIAPMGSKVRKRTYSKELIFKVLDDFYKLKTPLPLISEKFNIRDNYAGYIIRGEKCKNDYEEYMQDNPEILLNQKEIHSEVLRMTKLLTNKKVAKISDADILEAFESICSGHSTLAFQANRINTSSDHLLDVFKGKKRKNLNLDFSRYPQVIHGRTLTHMQIVNLVTSHIVAGKSVKEIMQLTGLGRTTIYRVKQKFESAHAIPTIMQHK